MNKDEELNKTDQIGEFREGQSTIHRRSRQRPNQTRASKEKTNFYENLAKLCEEHNTTISAVLAAAGVSRNTITFLKNTGTPPPIDKAAQVATRFNIPLEKLLYGDVDEVTDLDRAMKYINIDPELTQYMQELAVRPELKMLFSVSRGATVEDIKEAAQIIEQVYKKNREKS